MKSDWILDVLADLKTFAAANGLPALAEQLNDTAIIAHAEISARDEEIQGGPDGDELASGRDIRTIGASGHA
jgi:hypothetical protein